MLYTTRLILCLVDLCLPLAVWWWLRPARRETAAALLASGWALSAAAFAGVVSTYFGIAASSVPLLLGTPLDLLLGRAMLGGFVCALGFPSLSIRRLYVFALISDLAYGAIAGGGVNVRWLPLQALIVALYFIPAQLFARWTREGRDLPFRASLHIVFHAGLLLGVLPALIVACGGGSWSAPFARSSFVNKLYLQLLILPAVLLISSVQEFARRGSGTPMPADAPCRLVTSGTYAYVANPMQVGKFLVVVGWGLFWWNPWMVVAAFFGLLYSVGIASPREDNEMAQRFSGAWLSYRKHVRRWWPRWKPFAATFDGFSTADHRGARLYLRLECEPCRQLAHWIKERATGLLVLPIETHIGRITYDPSDGSEVEHGVVALARALEHVNLAWALFAWMLRLPGIARLAQLVADSLDPQSEAVCATPATTGASQ